MIAACTCWTAGVVLSDSDMSAISSLDKGKVGRTLVLDWGSSNPGELLAPTHMRKAHL